MACHDKREHITKINITNIVYPNQDKDIEISGGSRGNINVPDNIKLTFSAGIEYTDKTRSIIKNVGRLLLKKKVLMYGSKEVHATNNLDIYDAYKNLYLSEKEREEKLL